MSSDSVGGDLSFILFHVISGWSVFTLHNRFFFFSFVSIDSCWLYRTDTLTFYLYIIKYICVISVGHILSILTDVLLSWSILAFRTVFCLLINDLKLVCVTFTDPFDWLIDDLCQYCRIDIFPCWLTLIQITLLICYKNWTCRLIW